MAYFVPKISMSSLRIKSSTPWSVVVNTKNAGFLFLDCRFSPAPRICECYQMRHTRKKQVHTCQHLQTGLTSLPDWSFSSCSVVVGAGWVQTKETCLGGQVTDLSLTAGFIFTCSNLCSLCPQLSACGSGNQRRLSENRVTVFFVCTAIKNLKLSRTIPSSCIVIFSSVYWRHLQK